MTFWDGTRWVSDAPAPGPDRARRGRHVLGVAAEALLIAGLSFGLIAGTAFAAKGGNGNGGNANGGNPHAASAAAACSVDGTTVRATGLPTDEVLNFMVTDASGTWGWVLGFSGDGTWSETIAPRTGPTTYEFVSRTWGPNGSHYDVFAACSAES